MRSHVALLPHLSIEFGDEAQQNLDQVHVSLHVLRLLDLYQPFDAGSSIFDDSIDQCQCIPQKILIRVDLIDDREQNTDELFTVLILVELLSALTLFIQVLEGPDDV